MSIEKKILGIFSYTFSILVIKIIKARTSLRTEILCVGIPKITCNNLTEDSTARNKIFLYKRNCLVSEIQISEDYKVSYFLKVLCIPAICEI